MPACGRIRLCADSNSATDVPVVTDSSGELVCRALSYDELLVKDRLKMTFGIYLVPKDLSCAAAVHRGRIIFMTSVVSILWARHLRNNFAVAPQAEIRGNCRLFIATWSGIHRMYEELDVVVSRTSALMGEVE
ncbi:MAG: hypothetical protein U5O39_03875 [Gammaproteobacteria bacterium]|nr:hypothetical protein [Gammaproteobacteria bacterium]